MDADDKYRWQSLSLMLERVPREMWTPTLTAARTRLRTEAEGSVEHSPESIKDDFHALYALNYMAWKAKSDAKVQGPWRKSLSSLLGEIGEHFLTH